jgi:hypothetical protein
MAKPSEKETEPPKTRKAILEALGAYQRRGAWEVESEALLMDVFKNETDRGFIVVLGSHTEDFLLACILEKFPPISRSLQKDLTRGGGPLGSWAQLINMALAMGIIDDDDANDLEVFKAMRNACAHSRQGIDFNTPELRDAMGLLTVPGVSSLPQENDWRKIFRMMLAHTVRYFMGRFDGEIAKKTPQERYTDWLGNVPRAAPQASTRKQRQQLSKVASPNRPKQAPPRPPRSSRA